MKPLGPEFFDERREIERLQRDVDVAKKELNHFAQKQVAEAMARQIRAGWDARRAAWDAATRLPRPTFMQRMRSFFGQIVG